MISRLRALLIGVAASILRIFSLHIPQIGVASAIIRIFFCLLSRLAWTRWLSGQVLWVVGEAPFLQMRAWLNLALPCRYFLALAHYGSLFLFFLDFFFFFFDSVGFHQSTILACRFPVRRREICN
jgi:hypothetical protein